MLMSSAATGLETKQVIVTQQRNNRVRHFLTHFMILIRAAVPRAPSKTPRHHLSFGGAQTGLHEWNVWPQQYLDNQKHEKNIHTHACKYPPDTRAPTQPHAIIWWLRYISYVVAYRSTNKARHTRKNLKTRSCTTPRWVYA